jgi:excisionase family DNA binding protein
MVKDSQQRSREESLVDVSSRQLQRALEQTKQALKSHRRSLERLESALIEFQEDLNQPERRPERPQVKEQGGGGGAGSPDLVSITEVCQELGMGKSWVYRSIQSGEIPSVKLGDNIKVRREDLEGYLEANSSDS